MQRTWRSRRRATSACRGWKSSGRRRGGRCEGAPCCGAAAQELLAGCGQVVVMLCCAAGAMARAWPRGSRHAWRGSRQRQPFAAQPGVWPIVHERRSFHCRPACLSAAHAVLKGPCGCNRRPTLPHAPQRILVGRTQALVLPAAAWACLHRVLRGPSALLPLCYWRPLVLLLLLLLLLLPQTAACAVTALTTPFPRRSWCAAQRPSRCLA